MYLAYVDESGDRGIGGSQTYVLGCVLVRSSQWAKSFDDLISFRRFLRDKTNVPVRAEIKANHLLRNGGDLRGLGLSEKARHFIYRGLLRLQPTLGIQTFAIVINKALLKQRRPNDDPSIIAWTYLMQRLEHLTRRPQDQLLLLHDEGEPETVRKIARRFRRFGTAGSLFGGGYVIPPFIGLIDDPVSRNSRHSYFLQLADLNAYAAFRRGYPPPPQKVHIVPQLMWEELGAARFAAANKRAGGPSAGIVLWPK
jgi:Protein of unknown function (DUF3800)